MQASLLSQPGTARAGRALPRLDDAVPVELMQRALAWVIRQLRLRHGSDVLLLDGLPTIDTQTLLSFEEGLDLPCFWTIRSHLCHALHRHPDEVEALTRRWMRKLYHRQEAQHRGEVLWKLSFPWDQPHSGKGNPGSSVVVKS